jgi:hypothetical protein
VTKIELAITIAAVKEDSVKLIDVEGVDCHQTKYQDSSLKLPINSRLQVVVVRGSIVERILELKD